jgi:uncharacterized Zn finger protein
MKKVLIEEIVTEWAMISEDGLVGGPYTDENISALALALEKRGLSKEEVLEIINPMMDEAAKKKTNEPTEQVPESELDKKVNEKSYHPPALAEEIKKLLKEKDQANDPDFRMFIDKLHNKINGSGHESIDAAVKTYNDEIPSTVKISLDRLHTGQKRSALGRGEIAFVWIIQNAKHGGSSTGDIVIGNFKVDIKDYQDAISIEETSFSNFNRIEFVGDLLDLLARLRRSQDNIDYAKNILSKYDTELKQYVSSVATKGGKITADTVKNRTEEFLDQLTIGKLGVSAKVGLNFIGKKIQDILKQGGQATTVMSIYQAGKKHSAVIDDKDLFTNQPIQNTIDALTAGEKEIAINAKPMTKKDDSVILSSLAYADYFKKNWTDATMWENMAQYLHYDGIILLRGDKAMAYIPKEDFGKRFTLDAIGKGIRLKYRGDSSPAEE